MDISEMLHSQPHYPAGIPANTPEWHQQRLGFLTASRMAEAMAVRKDGKESAKRRNLMIEIVSARLTDIFPTHFVSEAMQWGIDHEPEAIEAARKILCLDIQEIGFVSHPSIEFFGATPDGAIGDDMLFEAKCPTSATHCAWIAANVVPPEYRPQMVAQLVSTGRRVCKFMSYDPRVRQRPIFYKHFAPSQAERDKVENCARQFLNEVEELFERVATTKPPKL